MEEGRPVDELAEGGEGEVVEDADAEEGWGGQVFGFPGDGSAACAGFFDGDYGLAWGGVGFAEGLVVGAMLGDEVGLAVVAEERGGDGDGAAGVEDVDDGLAVVRGDLDGGVSAAGGGSADEERDFEALALHFLGDVDHLVERGGDEAAEADHVGLLGFGALEDLFAGDHDAEVDDVVVVAGEDYADDVLADVVDVAFDGGEEDLALGFDDFAGGYPGGFFGFHEGREVGYGLLHDAGGFDHLREEHFAGAEEVAYYAHAVHEGAFDDEEWAAELDAGFFGVDLDVGVDAFYEGVGEALFYGAVAPLFGLLFAGDFAYAGGFEGFAEVYEALGGVGAAVEEDVFNQYFKFRLYLFVDFEHAGVDDAHVHAGGDGVIEEGGVHGFADLVVAAEAEGDVGDAAGDFGVGEVGLDPARGVDEVQGVVVVLLHAGGDGEDVGVEDDVFGSHADLVDEDAVGALADADLVFVGGGLALLVEGHDDYGGSVLLDGGGVLAEFVFALFERDGVDDSLALEGI